MPSPPEDIHAEQAKPPNEADSHEAPQVAHPEDPAAALPATAAPNEPPDEVDKPPAEEAPSTQQDVPERPDYKAVARISTQAVLQSIELASLHADYEDDAALPADWPASITTSSEASANFDREALKLTVHCGFDAVMARSASIGTEGEAREAGPFHLRARFRLEYALTGLDGILEGDEEHFARTNGMLHAWPYWREAAQSMTVRMGLAPLVVGTFKIPWSGDPGREKKASLPDRAAAHQKADSTTVDATTTATTAEARVDEKQTPASNG